MNKISITIDNSIMSFSKYNREISEDNLNNTNVINVKKLKFTEDYIIDNMELVYTFINLIVLKFNITKVKIKNVDIAETILKLLNNLTLIKTIIFTEEKELNYTISALLFENKNIERVECYNIPEVMFYKFDSDVIKTRCAILSTSSFFNYNNIKTYSDIYNKKSIIIFKLFNEDDITDLKYFFETNKNLKRLEFKSYNKINLETILKLLNKNNLKKIDIIIYEDESKTKEILNDIKLFEELNKKYDVNIKIKYSKEYKEKNKIKELNIIMLKYILITCICIGIIFFCAYKLLEKKDSSNIEKNVEQIQEVINQVQQEEKEEVEQIAENIEEKVDKQKNTHISSYYQDYSKVYNELLNINSDTVGWLTVNNTKINYPVVQTTDNEYYLNHAYDKTKNSAGWLFVDYRNDMNSISKNTIIYGHSMVNGGLMFSTLKNVLNSNWYNNEDNLIINFSIKDKEIKWKIFSIYTIENTNDYLNVGFSTEQSFLKFINKLKDRSIYNFGVEVNSDDKILTLSTCYKDDSHRLVIHALMIE